MRRWGVVWFACLTGVLMLFALSAAMASEPLATTTGGTLVIDVDGSVRDLTQPPDLSPAIAALIERSVRSWKFEPIVRGGKPIRARTGYSLKLVATPTDGGYAVRVEDVSFHSPRAIIRMPMQFVVGLMRLHQNVYVLVAIRGNKQGKVTDAAVLDVQPMDTGSVKRAGDYERIVEGGVKQWWFEPARTELGDTDEVSGKMVLMIGGSSLPRMAEWHLPAWSNAKPVPWETDQTQQSDKLQAGQFAAADPRVKLKTDIVGKTL